MKLLQVAIENFQKVEIVEFSPGEGSTLIAGRNEQGKSSTIAAIQAALGGKGEVPIEAVRHGSRKSRTKLELGEPGALEFVVEHKITETGRMLSVRNAEGVEQKSPQALLDSLYSKIAFDPLSFSRAKATEQDRILKDLGGVTEVFAELDGIRTVLYDARTEKNRQHKDAEARANGMPSHGGVPKEEVSIKAIAEELAAARAHEQARNSAQERIARQDADVQRAHNLVATLRAQLATAEDLLEKERGLLDGHIKSLAELEAVTDTTELEAKLTTAEETNSRVRANQAKRAEEKRAEALKDQADELTGKIEAIDAQKQKALEGAKFPVEGLGFNDIGPTLNGVPLAQASTARLLDLSVAIGIAQHPKLKLLLIREGAFLDDDALRRIDERAREAGAQLIIERVGTKDKGANVVIIENGRVQEAATTTAAE